VLERLEREYGGRWKLVKVNADVNPELIASFNLKSIPYAVVFVDGNAVAQFMGAQPEPYVRAFLDRIIPNPGAIEHRCAREALVKGQTAVAEDYLKNAIALDPANDGARLDMMGLLLDRDDLAGARAHLSLLSPKAEQQSTYGTTVARMQAAEVAAALPPADILQRRIRIDEQDLQARLELADLSIAKRDYAPALEQLYEIARRDRSFNADIGRRKMLDVFEMAADQEGLVSEYRSKLSAILF
jgi:putative thioredoxin